ncbi:hypothetical protein RUM43_002779 [Polyplax serrata]|uniref:AAA+ ATPase domain-containing protein n=1 Tax=Polyplax serrata TaxID=468196 RepID=A0AAN8PMU0_POLSC
MFYISWEEFKNDILAKGEVEKLIINMDTKEVGIVLHKGAVIKNKLAKQPFFILKISDISKFEEKLRECEQQLGISPKNGVPIEYHNIGMWSNLFVLIVIGLLALSFLKNKNFRFPGIADFMNIQKAKFTLVDPLAGQGKGVKFSDVAGLKEAKIEIMEFVDYLKRPERYRTLGAKVPKGALLLGPPGCGKTLLAKAVATEANVPFLSMNGSEFIEMIGGLGAARVRDLFKEAKKRIPCIVYIDEIDAIGKKRGTIDSSKADREEEQTLNQLLVEMDGVVSNEGVVLLASTNRADVLDSALLRPGRFDRQILIDLPTYEERRQIFEQHLKSIHLEQKPEQYSKKMAYLTPGFSGADIANVCNEAALHAARLKKTIVQGTDLEYAVERVVGGTEKRSTAMSPKEKEMLAYYEAGRGLVGWLSQYGEALLKITIVPRTNSVVGFSQFTQSEKFLFTKEELLGKMTMGLAGRVALSLIFNKVTSRSESDLKKVTRLAYAQVTTFGMGNNVGLMSFDSSETNGANQKRPYSKYLQSMYDHEARMLILSVYKETEKILLDNKDKLLKLTEELLKKETLNYDDIVNIIGPPPHAGKKLIEPFEFELSLQQALTGVEEPPTPSGNSKSAPKDENP